MATAAEVLGVTPTSIIEQVGTPGVLKLLPQDATAKAQVLVASRANGCVIAAASVRAATDARAVVFSHDGYDATFRAAALRWIGRSRVCDATNDLPLYIGPDGHSDTVLIISGAPHLPPERMAAVHDVVCEGGASLLVFVTPWGYCQLHGMKEPDLPHQAVCRFFGIELFPGYAEGPYVISADSRFATAGASAKAETPSSHADPTPATEDGEFSAVAVLGLSPSVVDNPAVSCISQCGTPGGIAVLGLDDGTVSRAVVVASQGEPRTVVAAARRADGSRAVVVAHDGYDAVFRNAALSWIFRTAVIDLTSTTPLPPFAGPRFHSQVVILVTGASAIASDRLRDAKRLIVEGGASLLMFVTPWGFGQLNNMSVDSIPHQQLAQIFGLRLTADYVGGPYSALRVKTAAAELPRLWRLLALPRDHAEVMRFCSDKGEPTVAAPMGASPGLIRHARDAWGEATFRTVLASHVQSSPWIHPFLDISMKRTCGRKTSGACALVHELCYAGALLPPPHFVPPFLRCHARMIRSPVPVTTRLLPRTAASHPWTSLGAYVAPGEAFSVALLAPPGTAASAVGAWSIQVGCHSDDISCQDDWQRPPKLTVSWPLSLEGKLNVPSTTYGGLIYAVQHQPNSVAIEMVVGGPAVAMAPCLFVSPAPQTVVFTHPTDQAARATAQSLLLAASSDEGLRAIALEQLPPMLEVVGTHLCVPLPTADVIQFSTRLPAVIANYDRMCECHHTLSRRRGPVNPQRFVFDVQISCGYMHSGYPVMAFITSIHTDFGSAQTIDREGSWGLFHEVGHNHQRTAWTFDGTGEVTVNLFTLHALDLMYNVKPSMKHSQLSNDGNQRNVREYLAAVKQQAPSSAVGTTATNAATRALFEKKWKQDPFLALTMYATLIDTFGWPAFAAVFEEYEALDITAAPWSEEKKMDEFFLRFSRIVNRNVAAWVSMEWAVPLTENSLSPAAGFPPFAATANF